MPVLVAPDTRYKGSFIQAVKDRLITSEHPEWVRSKMENFEEHLGYIQKLKEGKGAKGSTPQTIYWLVKGDKYLGEIHIRHRASGKIPNHIYYDVAPRERNKGYGKLILKLGLEKAKELGLNKVILVCNQNNIASSKIIEANGGILREDVQNSGEITKVYEIALK